MRDGKAPQGRRVAVAEEPLVAGVYDYADAFEVHLREPDARSAEQFARFAFEQAPWLTRRAIWLVHRYVLRFDLGPRSSPDHIFGWRIVTSEPDVIHLEATSSMARAVIIGRKVGPTRVVATTYVFYERPAMARAIWTIIGPLHRKLAPYLLARAAARAPDLLPTRQRR